MEGPRKRWAVLGGKAAGDQAASEEANGSVDGSRSILSRKELARELRRQAYRKAKEARANDPRQQALKERARLQRREQYRKAKEQRKAREAALEAKHVAAREAEQADAKRQLAERVRSAIGKAPGAGALARDIDRALQGAGVRELMERLRIESAALAARHQLEACHALGGSDADPLDAGNADARDADARDAMAAEDADDGRGALRD